MYDPNFPPPVQPVIPPPPAARNNLAMVSLVCGIIAGVTMIFNWVPNEILSYISCVSPIFALVALITGILGINFAKKHGQVGSGNAITGLVIGSLVLAMFLLIFAVGFIVGFTSAF